MEILMGIPIGIQITNRKAIPKDILIEILIETLIESKSSIRTRFEVESQVGFHVKPKNAHVLLHTINQN